MTIETEANTKAILHHSHKGLQYNHCMCNGNVKQTICITIGSKRNTKPENIANYVSVKYNPYFRKKW